MTREEAESNFDRNWDEMLELQKGKTDWAREEMRASVKGIYASDLREACISLEAQLKLKDQEIKRLNKVVDAALVLDGKLTAKDTNVTELWQPKEGEWCWFKVQKHDYPSAFVWGFGKYIENGICEIMGYKTNFINCEPFTEKIPNFLNKQ